MEHELTGRYPIILDGAETGEVTVSREGVFWRFEARCSPREELLRLSVYGEGAEGYLGVMEPSEGELRLSRRLSRSGVSGFPAAISYATRAGETPPQLRCDDEERSEAEVCEESGEDCGCDDELPSEQDRPPPAFSSLSDEAWRHCPCPCSLFSGLGAKLVCSKISGALTRKRGSLLTLAVPEEISHALPENDILIFTETETICGRRYCLAAVE